MQEVLCDALRECEAVPLELTEAGLRFVVVEILIKTKLSI